MWDHMSKSRLADYGFIIRHKEGVRRTAQVESRNPCFDDIPFVDCDYSKIEAREAALYGIDFHSKKDKEPFYEMSGKIYHGEIVVCLIRAQLISEFRRYDRLRCYGRIGTRRNSFRNMRFTPHYEDHTVKTDTAVYCTHYKYNKVLKQTRLSLALEGNITFSVVNGVVQPSKKLFDQNESIYFGKPFDFKEYEFERVRMRNYCKDINL